MTATPWDPRHLELAQLGADEIARFHAAHFSATTPSQLRLEQVDLAGADLSGALVTTGALDATNLELYQKLQRRQDRPTVHLGALLAGANLEEARLADSHLLNADLTQARLRDADLQRANLSHANLWGADLAEADLRGANLDYAILTNADLTGASLANVSLRYAMLAGAKLSATDLQSSNLTGSSFEEATLREADLADACMRQARLQEACIEGATLAGADLREADFSRATMNSADLSSADLQDATFLDADLSNATFDGTTIGPGLSAAIGLAATEHFGPSHMIATALLRPPHRHWPTAFLRGIGLTDFEVEHVRSIAAAQNAIDFFSCFISYSSKDDKFAVKLHDALQAKGIRCWLDKHEVLPGDEILGKINEGIRLWDKVLLLCSRESLTSNWVRREIKRAFEKEERLESQRGKKTLAVVPLDLDGHLFTDECESMFEFAADLRSRHAANFAGWDRTESIFDEQFERVVQALRADDMARSTPPRSKL